MIAEGRELSYRVIRRVCYGMYTQMSPMCVVPVRLFKVRNTLAFKFGESRLPVSHDTAPWREFEEKTFESHTCPTMTYIHCLHRGVCGARLEVVPDMMTNTTIHKPGLYLEYTSSCQVRTGFFYCLQPVFHIGSFNRKGPYYGARFQPQVA